MEKYKLININTRIDCLLYTHNSKPTFAHPRVPKKGEITFLVGELWKKREASEIRHFLFLFQSCHLQTECILSVLCHKVRPCLRGVWPVLTNSPSDGQLILPMSSPKVLK